MCGEKDTAPVSPIGVSGSPPRVRGKVMLPLQDYSLAGITPACAGKSILGKDRCLQRQDHPRVCGEKAFFAIAFSCLAGSPPRVRGKAAS